VVNEPSLAERLGGRWAISVAGHGIAVASAAVVVANLVRRETGGLHLAAAGLALLMAVAFTATVDVVLHHTLFARRAVTPVPVWWVLTKHVTAGLMLAFSVWWVSNGLVDGLDSPAPSLWVTLPALALWGGSAVVVTLDVWWRSARSRTALLAEADRLDMAALQQQALADEIARTRTRGVDDVVRRLRGELEDAAYSVASAPDAQGRDVARRLARDLRHASQGVVREASSDLWNHAERHLPRITWRMQLANTLQTQPFRPVVILTVGVMPRMLWEVGDLGLARGGSMTLVGALTLWGACLLANRAMQRWPGAHGALFVGTVVVLQIGQVVSAAVKNSWVPGYVTGPDLAVQVVTGVLLILFSSGWATFWDLTRHRDQVFAERMTPAREQALARSAALAQAARSLAQDLHGGAQARLFASAMALEEAADSGDVAALNQALAAARTVLEQPLSLPTVDLDLDSAVAAATQAWDGLCRVSVQRHVAVGDDFDAVVVRRVVDEALVNAVRHGGAGQVMVTLDVAQDGWLRVEVSDDGDAVTTGSRRGLGSAMFDHLAPGRWGRHADGAGTTLWLELAPRSPRSTA
jgi:signal transduction histidine kinase